MHRNNRLIYDSEPSVYSAMQQMCKEQEGQCQVIWHNSQPANTICYHLWAVHRDMGYQIPANCTGVNEHYLYLPDTLSTLSVNHKHAIQQARGINNSLNIGLIIVIILQLKLTKAPARLALMVIFQQLIVNAFKISWGVVLLFDHVIGIRKVSHRQEHIPFLNKGTIKAQGLVEDLHMGIVCWWVAGSVWCHHIKWHCTMACERMYRIYVRLEGAIS